MGKISLELSALKKKINWKYSSHSLGSLWTIDKCCWLTAKGWKGNWGIHILEDRFYIYDHFYSNSY